MNKLNVVSGGYYCGDEKFYVIEAINIWALDYHDIAYRTDGTYIRYQCVLYEKNGKDSWKRTILTVKPSQLPEEVLEFLKQYNYKIKDDVE